MKTLKELEQLGVRELSVSNGQAVAVNPYDWTDAKGVERYLMNHEVADNNNHIKVAALPPLPCAESVKEGTYPIEMFEEQGQIYNGNTGQWINAQIRSSQFSDNSDQSVRYILILKEQPIDNLKFKLSELEKEINELGPNWNLFGKVDRMKSLIKDCLSEPVAESDFPRRNRLDLNTPAELAVYNAMQEVEKLDADIRLTNAGLLLQQAKNLIADYIDGTNNPL